MDNRLLGQMGENMAADIMRAKGYRIIRQNYRCKFGEIDIIAEKFGDISFVEVKTRQSYKFGRPCEAIDRKKISNLKNTAKCFLDEYKDKGLIPRRYGFDVIEIVIEHTPNAF